MEQFGKFEWETADKTVISYDEAMSMLDNVIIGMDSREDESLSDDEHLERCAELVRVIELVNTNAKDWELSGKVSDEQAKELLRKLIYLNDLVIADMKKFVED